MFIPFIPMRQTSRRRTGLALYPDWSEHIVTIVAASLAVLVVALIAVVMGMA
jgi:hypothetical protein